MFVGFYGFLIHSQPDIRETTGPPAIRFTVEATVVEVGIKDRRHTWDKLDHSEEKKKNTGCLVQK